MKTYGEEIPIWELGTARRCMRGAFATAALLAVLLLPGLSETWLFALASFGAYEGLTAILNVDFVYGVFYICGVSPSPAARTEKASNATFDTAVSEDEPLGYQTYA
jgi:hypothetical protein